MVDSKAHRRSSVRNRQHPWLVFDCLLLIFAVATAGIIYYYLTPAIDDEAPIEEKIVVVSEPEPEEPEEPEIIEVDFQPTVDAWAKTIGGNKSVLIYDIELSKFIGSYNPDESYGTASLYKLFVVYEGYRRLESGEWDENQAVGRTGYTILDCLDLAIRESNSTCAEALWAMIGQQNLDQIIKTDFNIRNSTISRLLSNPKDITKIMLRFYEHPDIKDEKLLARLKDSFLNQPETTYDWRQGLPSGFSKDVDVYNKVGWEYNAEKRYWNIYHDTAIVEFPDADRHFIVTVMTNYVDYPDIAGLGKEIEKTFTAALDQAY